MHLAGELDDGRARAGLDEGAAVGAALGGEGSQPAVTIVAGGRPVRSGLRSGDSRGSRRSAVPA